ncbi:MAG: hypothetical protein P9M07_02075 [Candidatus Aceula meridiana]|nr:hypothetical protein [Candidatus Aceula meridiana]
MGITYKLKKEVVGYILDQKQANSSLSCRKLAEMASEHFHKKISKSSVNSILKQTALSSPIGRRASKKKAPSVFKLPEYRKEQLFQKAPLHLVETPKIEPKAPEPEIEIGASGSISAMLLKAVQWEVCREPLLSAILSKYSDCPLSREIDSICDALLMMPIFGIRRAEDLSNPEGKSLREFLGLSQPFDLVKISKVLNSLQALEKNKIQILLEYSQIFTEIELFRIILENDTELSIDARMNSVWTKDNVHSSGSLPLNKALDFLSREIVANNSPVILREVSQESFALNLSTMFYAFENVDSFRIKRIELIDGKQEIMTSFDNILNRKRQAIIGLSADQPEIRQLVDDNAQKKSFSLPFFQKNVVYQSFQTTMPIVNSSHAFSLRGAVFSIEGQPNSRAALITNISEKDASIEQNISSYAKRWINWAQSGDEKKDKNPDRAQKSFSLDEKESLGIDCSAFSTAPFAGIIVKNIVVRLYELAQQYFLPPAETKRSFEETCRAFSCLKGLIAKDNNFIKVHLDPPKNSSNWKALQHIAFRVNQAAIFEPLTGQRLLFVPPSQKTILS